MATDKVNYSYPELSSIAQAIKYQIRAGTHWDDLSGPAKESLDQIASAIARTVAGDGFYWDAIVGFAQSARPTTDDPPTVDLERGIRHLVRELPRNGNAQS